MSRHAACRECKLCELAIPPRDGRRNDERNRNTAEALSALYAWRQ